MFVQNNAVLPKPKVIYESDTPNYNFYDSKDTVEVRDTFYTRYGKRILDIVICSIGLIFALPIMGIIAVITFFDVGAPVIFKQTRIGKDCKPFTIVKFKNMTNERDENGELLLAEYRVTKIGKKIRQTSLDELPQLFLILKGDMSIIGPRPLLPEYLCRYDSRQIMRHAVRPGLECPTYFPMDHVWSWEEQFENDVWYVENCSLKVDIHLCFRVIQMVFDRKGSKTRAAANRGAFKEDVFGEIR